MKYGHYLLERIPSEIDIMDESIDIYSENNESLNIIKLRSEAHRRGLWHRTAHVWIYNRKAEILLQLRSDSKSIFPNMWDVSSAGHIGAGEIPVESAIRELYEEIGLKAAIEELKFYKIKKQSSIYRNFLDNEFNYIYFLKFDGDLANFKLQKEEVTDLKFCHSKELKNEINNIPESFVPHGQYWFEIIKEVENHI